MSALTTRRRYANSAPAATLTVGINAAVTTFAVSSGTGWPAVPFTAALDYYGAAEEVVLVTGMSGITVTSCVRGYDGTAPQAHAVGAAFVHTTIAQDADEANDHTSSEAAHGTVGEIIGATDAQTLTNKTISSSLHLATATEVAAHLQAFASGAQSLLEGYDSAGAVLLFKVGRTGDVFMVSTDPAKKLLVIKGAAAQSANLLEVQNSAGLQLLTALAGGRLVHKPTDVTGAAVKYVPPSSAAATYLALRAADDLSDQFLLTTAGEIASAAKLWLRGFFTDDPIRYPLDGSLFRVGSDGTLFCRNPTGRIGDRHASDSAAMAATAGEAKDTGVGDIAFTAVAGRRYRVKYQARAESVSATATCDFRIRDGGASSPTTGSTLLAGASSGSMAIGGPDARQLIVDEIISGLSAGVHTVGAFYTSTAGGTVRAGQASGQSRQLSVYDEGPL